MISVLKKNVFSGKSILVTGAGRGSSKGTAISFVGTEMLKCLCAQYNERKFRRKEMCLKCPVHQDLSNWEEIRNTVEKKCKR